VVVSWALLAGALILSGPVSAAQGRTAHSVRAALDLRDVPLHASGKSEDVVPRPNNGGSYGYAGTACSGPSNPCYRLARPHVVIHWVELGVDAPPLNDDDRNDLPDYVEEVADAAETSFTYFATHGFIAPRPDTAGSDSKPDIYIKHFQRTQGLYGVTFAWTHAEGGTFVIVGNDLDRDPQKAVGGLKPTVAHELFHVIQYSYVPNGEIPAWVAEGSASALSIEVYPDIEDVVDQDYLDLWLRQTWRPLYDNRFKCDHCYGGSLWWRFIYAQQGHVLSEYLGRLYGYQKIGRPLLLGTQPLDEILRKKRYGGLFDTFTYFSRWLYTSGTLPEPTYTLRAPTKPGVVAETPVRTVEGLSAHFIPIIVPAAARTLLVQTITGEGPLPDVTVIVGGAKGRVVKPKTATAKGVRKALFEITFRTAAERKQVELIVTSGRQEGAKYLASYGWF
jgi:hypothetical protein